MERGSSRIASSGPEAMISPPCSPAPGPMSTTQSAVRIVSSSCSTTRSVLPEVAEARERRDQLRVVALVEPDRGLVEDVEDADERASDLRREADPLGLAARERGAGPVDREVIEADVGEEPKAGDDLLEEHPGDRPLAVAERDRQRLHPGEGVGHAHRRDVVDAPAVDRDGEGLRPQPAAGADRARSGDHVLLDLGLDVLRLGLAEAPLEVGHEPLEGGPVGVLASLVTVADEDLLFLGRMEEVLDGLRRQVADRRPNLPAVLGEDRLQDLHPPRGLGGHPRPRHQGAPGDALGAVRDHEVGIDDELGPDPGAGGAGAVGGVEGEAPGLELVDGRPVVGAAVALAVAAFLERGRFAVPGRRRHDDHALAEAQRGLDRIGQAGRVGRRLARALGSAHDEAVDDHLDRVALVLVEGDRVGQVHLLAVDANPHEALLAGRLEDPVPFGLAVLHEGAQDEEAGFRWKAEDLVDDLLDRLALDLASAGRAVRMADAGEEEPQVIVDLGDGPDRRARVAAGTLLIDGDRRREPVDLVDVRLLHLAQELAGVRREALDVAALPLGVDRVEGEAALPRAGQPGDHDEPVARQRHRHVLEVVLARAAHDQLVGGHARSLRRSGHFVRVF